MLSSIHLAAPGSIRFLWTGDGYCICSAILLKTPSISTKAA